MAPGSQKRAHEGDHAHSKNGMTKKVRTSTGLDAPPRRRQSTPYSSSIGHEVDTTTTMTVRGHNHTSTGLSTTRHRSPASIVGLPAVILRLPEDTCREVINSLTESEIRDLLIAHVKTDRDGPAAAQLAGAYDSFFAPRRDKLVGFNQVVKTVMNLLQPLVDARASANPMAYMRDFNSALRVQHGVFTNIRLIWATATDPASFGTKTRAVEALVKINAFIVHNLMDTQPEIDQWEGCPLGDALLEIVTSLHSKPELKVMVFEKVGAALTEQVSLLAKRNVGSFSGVEAAYLLLADTAQEADFEDLAPILNLPARERDGGEGDGDGDIAGRYDDDEPQLLDAP
ncbi:hypothetical protein OQA88_10542 [Cercophora sp. LCS_1]